MQGYGGYGGPPQGYGMALQQGYGMPQQYGAPGGYGGGGRPAREPPQMTAEDLERITKTIHVAGIRGLRGQPGIQPGEEITEEDLAAFFGNDGEVRPDASIPTRRADIHTRTARGGVEGHNGSELPTHPLHQVFFVFFLPP